MACKAIIIIWVNVILLCNISCGQNIDINILKLTNLNRASSNDAWVTKYSDAAPYVFSSVPFILYTLGFVNKNQKLKRTAIDAGMCAAISGGTTYVLKNIINRPRPAVTYPYLQALEPVTKYSMPSGHTSSVFCIATSITLNYKKWYYTVPAYSLAGLCAYSRLYNGVHYPSDVAAGMAVGVASAYISHKINNYWYSHLHKHKYYKAIIW
jgi:membrane-associated phospholipid phosphatase